MCLPCESDSENILANLLWTGIAGSWPGGISWALVEADVTRQWKWSLMILYTFAGAKMKISISTPLGAWRSIKMHFAIFAQINDCCSQSLE